MHKTLIILFLAILTGCVSVIANIKKENTTEINSISSSKDKKIRFDLELKTHERDVFEKGHGRRKANLFFDSILDDIRNTKVPKSIHEVPTKVNEILFDKLYQDDYQLVVRVDEKILHEDHSRFLRVITFGAVPEIFLKEVKFEIELTDLKTKKIYYLKKEYLIDMKISSVVIFFPYDFNVHPFSHSQQITFYKSLILPDILKLLSIEGKNESI